MISNELILAGKLQLKKLQKKKPEKNSGFDGAWTRASQILVGRSTNWATKPYVGSEANFSEKHTFSCEPSDKINIR